MLRKAIAPHLPPLQLTWEQVEPLFVAATEGGVGGMLDRARALLHRAGTSDAAAAAETLMLEIAGEAGGWTWTSFSLPASPGAALPAVVFTTCSPCANGLSEKWYVR